MISLRRHCIVATLSFGVVPAVLSASDEDITASRETAVVRAIERVTPSVVSILVTHRERVVYRYRDPFFDLFFPMSPFGSLYRRGNIQNVSGGSGLIVSEDGHILTNDHIVGNPRSLRSLEISLPDGRQLEARYLASDHFVDLAVLKVDADDLPVAPLGQSGDILVGEWAIAIGNPFALGISPSIGIVSGIDRDFGEPQGKYFYRDMVQTDAAINRGNSGGPLVNGLGEVIGINSFIITGDESIGSAGVGFAIPIDAGRKFLDEISTYGRVRQGWTGIAEIRDVTKRLAEYLGLQDASGAIVARVSVDSPAYLAGIDELDVILGINGEVTRSAQDVKGILKALRVGETCVLDLYRDGKRQQVSFVLEEIQRQRWY